MKYRMERSPGKSSNQFVIIESRTGAWVRWFFTEIRARAYLAYLNAGGDPNGTGIG